MEVTRETTLTNERPEMNRRALTILVTLAEVFIIASIALVGVWTGYYRGGFAWTEDPKKEFNYHPLLMVIGLALVFGNAILSYRVMFRSVRKVYAKLVHAGLLACTAILWSVGLKAAFDSHNLANPPIPNLYTLHSWLGLATVSLFGLQWILGLVSFLLPIFPNRWRALVKPIHVILGTLIFMLAVGTVFAGITEKLLWTLKEKYSQYASEGIVANCLGMSLAAAAVMVVYILNNPSYVRRPLPID